MVGEIMLYAGDYVPDGFLACDGAAISRESFPDLFDVIGETYGAGDGTTTFNLPDLRGRAVIGDGEGTGLTPRVTGDSGGEESHTLTVGELAEHYHAEQRGGQALIDAAGADTSENFLSRENASFEGNGENTMSAGLSEPHNNMQPFLTLRYCIAYIGSAGGAIEDAILIAAERIITALTEA